MLPYPTSNDLLGTSSASVDPRTVPAGSGDYPTMGPRRPRTIYNVNGSSGLTYSLTNKLLKLTPSAPKRLVTYANKANKALRQTLVDKLSNGAFEFGRAAKKYTKRIAKKAVALSVSTVATGVTGNPYVGVVAGVATQGIEDRLFPDNLNEPNVASKELPPPNPDDDMDVFEPNMDDMDFDEIYKQSRSKPKWVPKHQRGTPPRHRQSPKKFTPQGKPNRGRARQNPLDVQVVRNVPRRGSQKKKKKKRYGV